MIKPTFDVYFSIASLGHMCVLICLMVLQRNDLEVLVEELCARLKAVAIEGNSDWSKQTKPAASEEQKQAVINIDPKELAKK